MLQYVYCNQKTVFNLITNICTDIKCICKYAIIENRSKLKLLLNNFKGLFGNTLYNCWVMECNGFDWLQKRMPLVMSYYRLRPVIADIGFIAYPPPLSPAPHFIEIWINPFELSPKMKLSLFIVFYSHASSYYSHGCATSYNVMFMSNRRHKLVE